MLYLLPSLAPVLAVVAAAVGFGWNERLPRSARRAIEVLIGVAVGVALAVALALVAAGPGTSPLLGRDGFGLSVRVDVISATVLLLVTFVGWVVTRFAITYLDGEPGQGRFLGWLCLTLASVLTLVVAGNLILLVTTWSITSLGLTQLLLFYAERPAARRAARKKFVIARISDMSLVAAAVLLALHFGTGDIATIDAAARVGGGGGLVTLAAALLVIAAMLKSAQFPAHGWLTEVMEAPTPVSALLHAGVINAGGFLLIRFADVVVQSPGALAALVMIGGFTAVFGGLVMLTQPAVKTSLAWSTIAQMGFMMMQCGLALFPLALLHLVAHSLYKAHAFLSSGGAVERIATFRRPGSAAVPSLAAVGRAFLVALALYGLIGGGAAALLRPSAQALALGAILVFGIAYLLAQGLADAAPQALTRRLAVLAAAAAGGYFVLHIAADWMFGNSVPPPPRPGPLEWVLIVLAVISFGVVAVAQATFALWAYHPAAAGLRVHLSNGLYVNAVIDRLTGGWRRRAQPHMAVV